MAKQRKRKRSRAEVVGGVKCATQIPGWEVELVLAALARLLGAEGVVPKGERRGPAT